MPYSIQQYMEFHGGRLLVTIPSGESDPPTIAIARDKSLALYGFPLDPLEESTLTEDQKELVALTAIWELVGYAIEQNGLNGLVKKVAIGSDGSPTVEFFDRLKSFTDWQQSMRHKLSVLQRKLGYAPEDSGMMDTPFVSKKLPTFGITGTEGEFR